MAGWNPLQSPMQHLHLIEEFKDILYDGKKQSGVDSFGKFVRFCLQMSIWMKIFIISFCFLSRIMEISF